MAKKIEPRLDRLDPKKFIQRMRGRLLIFRTFGPWAFATIRFGRLMGNPVTAIARAIKRKVSKWCSPKGATSRRPRRVIRVAMLPFEEQHSIDAARLENCKAVFAYEDTDDGQVKYFPACGWYPFRNPRLEKISQKYGIVRYGGKAPETTEKPVTA
jgi:hypothetical protein